MSDEDYYDVDAERRERMGRTLRFRLGGEDFVVPGNGVPYTAIMDLAAQADRDGFEAELAYRDFLLDVLAADEDTRARLIAAMRRARVTKDELQTVVAWLVQRATARPTTRRSGLPESPRRSGRRSKVVSLSRGTAKDSAA